MIVRNRPSRDYSVIRNKPLELTDLSLKAKGLWAFLMTKPDGWKVTVRGLQAQLPEGKEAIMAALHELEGAGLYRKIKTQNSSGHFDYEDFVYDKPCTENPHTEKPHTENTQQVKTKIVKTDKANTEIDTTPAKAGQIAQVLHTLVKENYNFVKLTEAQFRQWAKDIEKIHRIDGYPYEVIEAVVRWSQEDDFWKQNIRSGTKLRKQFETLLVRMKSQKQRVEVIS